MKKGGSSEVLRIAYPLIVSSGSVSLMLFCDRMFLAWFSDEALRAALPASILAFTFECLFLGLVSYGNTFVAQYFGSGQFERCGRATAQSILLALLSWPLQLALIPLGLFLLKLSGHPAEIYALERPYFIILLASASLQHLGVALSTFYTGRGRTLMTMFANLAGNSVNVGLNYLLIFGHGGFPRLGIVGAGIATAVGSAVTPLILLIPYLSRHNDQQFGTRRMFGFDAPLMKRMIRFGLPAAVNFALDLASFSVFVLLLGRMPPLQHAAGNIALSINLISFLPMVGMGIAASALVGQYQGSNDSATAARSGWSALRLSMVYTAAVSLTFILFPEFYTRFFLEKGPGAVPIEDLLPIVRPLLWLLMLWSVTDGASIVVAGALKGAGDTRFVMVYSVALAWLFFVPGQLIIVLRLNKGLLWAWAWTGLYIAVLAAGYILRWAAGHWKSIDVIDRPTPAA